MIDKLLLVLLFVQGVLLGLMISGLVPWYLALIPLYLIAGMLAVFIVAFGTFAYVMNKDG